MNFIHIIATTLTPHNFLLFPASIPRIPRNRIHVLQDLGEGAFGRVYLAMCELPLASINSDGSEVETTDPTSLVAVKTLKENHAEDARQSFDREAELLTNLQHDNIVRLFGISDDGEIRMIVFEYMKNGDLNNFLK